MVAPHLRGHWSVVVATVVSASRMLADANLETALFRPEMMLYQERSKS